MVLAQASNEEVVEPIIIVIADGHSHSPTHVRQASLVRHIIKSAVTVVVVIKSAPSLRARLQQIDRQGVNKKNIRIAIVVVIKQRNSATHRFNYVFFIGRSNVFKSYPGLGRNIRKSDPFRLM